MSRQVRLSGGMRWVLVVLAACGWWDPAIGAQESAETAANAGIDLTTLEWRNVGPGGVGGRISDFAVVPDDPDTIYAAVSQGGVWKTTNGGASWVPIFDDQPRQAIGGIALAPTNPNVIWVGTGEANGRNLVSTSWGDGVYKSEDGGATWQHMGLENSLHIGRIRIDPRDENVVFVTVAGALAHEDPAANDARGLFRTTDGGETWEEVLDAGPYAGFVDIDFDPRDPDLLYATSWHRQRVDWSWIPTGEGSAVWRSRDGGDTWVRLGNGLPESDMGRIGVSVCRSQPDTVYLNVEGSEGGVFRSDDRGASWARTNPNVRGSMYYSQVRCDPNEPERVYVLSTFFMVSHDGGVTFENEMSGHQVHVDHHALWINPEDSDHLVLGNDGGIYTSRDRGGVWHFSDNVSITQFYEVGVDNQRPFYRVYGGTQDNNSVGAPSGTRNVVGITNDDWFLTVGGDGFYVRPDPEEPEIVYTEWQFGNLARFDTRTGERKWIKPADPRGCVPLSDEDADPETPRCYRWNWSAPIHISQFDHETIYFAANVVFRSRDRGDSWEVISDDLSRQITYDNPMNDYGTIRVISESPRQPGLLAVGTDDGLVHVSDDDGTTWRQSEALPGVPERSLVRRLVLSAHDDSTMYVASSGHEYYDFTPYLLRSSDRGQSWDDIRANLPDGSPIRAFAEHPGVPGLLFVGTEHGVWTSVDDGDSWHPLQAGLPPTAIHDLVIQPEANDLVVGTHGRGIWILDDMGALAALASLDGDVSWVAPMRDAYQIYRFDRGRYFRGDTYYASPNPPDGAVVQVNVSTGETARPETATDEWESPELRLRVLDQDGALVRRLPAPTGAGLHRVVWDLRYDPTWRDPEGDATVASPWVLPGTYTVELQVGEASHQEQIEVVLDPLLDISPTDLRLRHDSQRRLADLASVQRQLAGLVRQLADATDAARAAVEEAEVRTEAIDGVLDQVEEKLEAMRGDLTALQRGPMRLAGQMRSAVSRPTADQMSAIAHLTEELPALVETANALAEVDLPGLGRLLDEAGVVWTPGRMVIVR
ncbi:MAG: glycosyl hydrolase [Acidobacteria bacterium]|nr:glycosyl hydrolase [Acidobacteriota bacterium]